MQKVTTWIVGEKSPKELKRQQPTLHYGSSPAQGSAQDSPCRETTWPYAAVPVSSFYDSMTKKVLQLQWRLAGNAFVIALHVTGLMIPSQTQTYAPCTPKTLPEGQWELGVKTVARTNTRGEDRGGKRDSGVCYKPWDWFGLRIFSINLRIKHVFF